MNNVSSIRKVFEVGYKNEVGDFHREVCFEHELEIITDNIEGDNCRLLYVREADQNDVAVLVRISSDAQLRQLIELATSELYNRLISSQMDNIVKEVE